MLTEADVSSWMVAGSYKTRYAGRHGYEVGLSYATQRYDGGNPLALRDVTDGNRNVGTVYGHDDFAIFPLLTVSYGGEYARYDYLGERSLLSPEVGATFRPVDGLRVTASLSQRSVAPGAEEFHPPGDSGIWLPPQRTFSSLDRTLPFEAERSTQAAIGLERDFGVSTVALRAFRQRVDDQLVTLFGADLQPASKVGHYLVGNLGDASATGYSAEFRLVLTDRVRGAVEYSVANAELTPRKNLRAVLLLTPAALRSGPERIHDVSTSVEATLHETSTRILALYRVSNGFIPSVGGSDPPGRALDARFDVQLRQSLPFMNFSNARWEMLVAVRNFFHETAPTQSIFDELLVARPPKRVIGGVTLHF